MRAALTTGIRYTHLWPDGPMLRVATGFQDSAALPARRDRRMVFHEYVLNATVDPADMTLAAITVTAGSLPFPTCLAAPATAGALVGQPLAQFGTLVAVVLAGTGGCTHLNEVLRNLSDVMAAQLVRLQDAKTHA